MITIRILIIKNCFFLFVHRDAPPLLPSDTTQGYRTVKAKLGCKKVRPWKWMPFTNPARRDGAIFHHWRRVAEEGKDYPFARFNKVGKTLFCLCSTGKKDMWLQLPVLSHYSSFFTVSLFYLYRQCRCQCTRSKSTKCISTMMAGLKQRQTTCLTFASGLTYASSLSMTDMITSNTE